MLEDDELSVTVMPLDPADRRLPDDPRLRLRMVKLLIRARRFASAEEEADARRDRALIRNVPGLDGNVVTLRQQQREDDTMQVLGLPTMALESTLSILRCDVIDNEVDSDEETSSMMIVDEVAPEAPMYRTLPALTTSLSACMVSSIGVSPS